MSKNYDQDPDIDFASNPYGGWTGVIGEQYAGTVTLCGVGVDKNSFDEAFIGGIAPPQEEDDVITILGQFADTIPWQKSYLVYVDSQGRVLRQLVASAGAYEALLAAGYPTKKLATVEQIATG